MENGSLDSLIKKFGKINENLSAIYIEQVLAGLDFLHSKKVFLVGIDTPSIDPANDKILESHNAVFKNDMSILEGIVLSHVEAGLYELVALPLNILGADATPVRAILLK